MALLRLPLIRRQKFVIVRIREYAEMLDVSHFVVAKMIHEFLEKYGEGYIGRIADPIRILRAPDRFYLVIDKKNRIIAVAAIRLRNGYISKVCVKPTHRHRGIATKLSHHLIKIARKHGLKKVWFKTKKNNTPMQKLAAKLGFTKTKQRNNYYIYEKELG